MSRHASQNPVPPSGEPPKKGFGVSASPFNKVKMELGIALILGIVLWLAADSITASFTTQLVILASYGLISAGWLVYRTQRIVQQWQSNNQVAESEKKNTTSKED